MRSVVFVPEKIGAPGLALLDEHCEVLAPWREGRQLTDAELRGMLAGVDAVIVRLFVIRKDDLPRAPRLRAIAKHGIGVDNLDCDAATERGIPIVYTASASANTVAEHALTLLLALTRSTVPAAIAVREGRFRERDKFLGVDVHGKTLGIIGLGRIGSRLAQKAALGLGMRVIAYDPPLDKSTYSGPATFVDSLEELLATSDFLSLHVPLTPETRRMIDAAALRHVKPGCRLVNTSRGAVIDELALAAALGEGRLAGAALDVFEQEPLPKDHPLCAAPNTLLTPHISASTVESWDAVSRQAAEGVLDVLAGRRPEFLINPEVYDRSPSPSGRGPG